MGRSSRCQPFKQRHQAAFVRPAQNRTECPGSSRSRRMKAQVETADAKEYSHVTFNFSVPFALPKCGHDDQPDLVYFLLCSLRRAPEHQFLCSGRQSLLRGSSCSPRLSAPGMYVWLELEPWPETMSRDRRKRSGKRQASVNDTMMLAASMFNRDF